MVVQRFFCPKDFGENGGAVVLGELQSRRACLSLAGRCFAVVLPVGAKAAAAPGV